MNDQTQDIKISVIGLGYVGLPLSCLLSRKFEVVGYEKDYRKVEDILRGKEVVREPGLQALLNESLSTGRLSLTSDTSRLVKSNIKIITVGTPFILQTMETDFSQLDSSLNDIIPQLNKGDILILKSTVPPGTTMGRVKDIVEKSGLKVPDDIGLSFSPERMVEGQAISDFLSLPKIIGASDDKTSSIVKEIFSALGGTIVEVSSPETAEMVKMVDNYSRFVFIGLTNEIALMSEKVGVDVIELIKSAKLDYPRNAGLLKPGPGVGGSCLNKDPFILESYMLKKGLKLEMVEAAKSINYGMASHVVSLVKKFSYGKKNITVLGVAFKLSLIHI